MDERFDCPICGSQFPSDEELRFHGRHEHGETFLAAIKERLKEDGVPVGEVGRDDSGYGDLNP
jgi:hypothetical protein